MGRKIKVSLCISTYNWPAALELCLRSVLLQTHMPDEVIIGDDGSTAETRQLIDTMRAKFPVPLHHVWQPDEGFQLARIRNRSFAKASGDYIIQVDGDLVLHKDFVRDHLAFSGKGRFISGSRSLLTSAATEQLFREKNIESVAGYQLDKKYNAIRFLPAAYLNFHLQKGISQVQFVLGANMSFWKEDLVTVNGYNEDFTGWGKEDNDLSVRLSNARIRLHFLKFAGIIYHLFHKEAPRDKMHQNEVLLMQAMQERQTFVANGLNKYLK